MARSVYKICACGDHVKCRHPWWFSFKRRACYVSLDADAPQR